MREAIIRYHESALNRLYELRRADAPTGSVDLVEASIDTRLQIIALNREYAQKDSSTHSDISWLLEQVDRFRRKLATIHSLHSSYVKWASKEIEKLEHSAAKDKVSS